MSTRISRGFDLLAPYYDALARMVIGRDIVNSQLHFLKSFKACHHILILGGGSGWLLDSLLRACPDIKIDYVDVSAKMLSAAKERCLNSVRINFIQGTEDNIQVGLYDGVITNFYLDMFDERKIVTVIEKVKRSLVNPAQWVVTDFVNERRWHTVMLWMMYRFFRIMTSIEATHLCDWHHIMALSGGKLLDSKEFKNGFIKSNRYQLTGSSN